MTHYKSNLRDLEFNLFEVFGADQAFGQEPYSDLDVDTARSILAEVDRLAREDLAASYATATATRRSSTRPRTPRRCRTRSRSRTRRSWRPSSGAWTCPPELGGTRAPRALWWSLAELVLGSNAADLDVRLRPVLRARAATPRAPSEQKEWAKLFVEKQWGSTMVLTEPDAGSDVGAGRTRADPAARRVVAHRGRQALHHQR